MYMWTYANVGVSRCLIDTTTHYVIIVHWCLCTDL